MDYLELPIADLLKRCIDHNNEAAWNEFIRRFHRTVAGTVARTLRAGGPCRPELVEDMVQDTFLRLCADRSRSLREFVATDEVSFYGFLRTTAISAVRDHFRRTRSIKRQADAIAEPIDSVISDSAASNESEQQYENSILLQRVDGLLQSGAPDDERNRFIFWLHYRDGFSATEIARLPNVGLTTKGVETVLRRLLNAVKRDNLSAGAGKTTSS